MSLLSYLSNLFAPSPGEPTSEWVMSPPPPIPPDPEPSCLARGIAKAWIEDRSAWTIERICLKDAGGDRYVLSYSRVHLHHPLGISISLKEPHDEAIIDDMDVDINGKLKIWYTTGRVRHVTQMERDYCHVRDAIYQYPYAELAARREQAAQTDATRAQNIKAIEALGCQEGKA